MDDLFHRRNLGQMQQKKDPHQDEDLMNYLEETIDEDFEDDGDDLPMECMWPNFEYNNNHRSSSLSAFPAESR